MSRTKIGIWAFIEIQLAVITCPVGKTRTPIRSISILTGTSILTWTVQYTFIYISITMSSIPAYVTGAGVKTRCVWTISITVAWIIEAFINVFSAIFPWPVWRTHTYIATNHIDTSRSIFTRGVYRTLVDIAFTVSTEQSNRTRALEGSIQVTTRAIVLTNVRKTFINVLLTVCSRPSGPTRTGKVSVCQVKTRPSILTGCFCAFSNLAFTLIPGIACEMY